MNITKHTQIIEKVTYQIVVEQFDLFDRIMHSASEKIKRAKTQGKFDKLTSSWELEIPIAVMAQEKTKLCHYFFNESNFVELFPELLNEIDGLNEQLGQKEFVADLTIACENYEITIEGILF